MTTLKEENRKLQERLKNTQKSLRESQKRQKSAERERDVALKRIQNITKSKDKDKGRHKYAKQKSGLPPDASSGTRSF